jgi:hypothetical protein
LVLRLEATGSDIGLGTLSTYVDNSQPSELGSDARLEIDTVVIRWRKRANRVTGGKQTLACGVLDGLQIADRFDAVRRREGIFTSNRPEKISRWGMRLEKNGRAYSGMSPKFLMARVISLQSPEISLISVRHGCAAGCQSARPCQS